MHVYFHAEAETWILNSWLNLENGPAAQSLSKKSQWPF